MREGGAPSVRPGRLSPGGQRRLRRGRRGGVGPRRHGVPPCGALGRRGARRLGPCPAGPLGRGWLRPARPRRRAQRLGQRIGGEPAPQRPQDPPRLRRGGEERPHLGLVEHLPQVGGGTSHAILEEHRPARNGRRGRRRGGLGRGSWCRARGGPAGRGRRPHAGPGAARAAPRPGGAGRRRSARAARRSAAGCGRDSSTAAPRSARASPACPAAGASRCRPPCTASSPR